MIAAIPHILRDILYRIDHVVGYVDAVVSSNSDDILEVQILRNKSVLTTHLIHPQHTSKVSLEIPVALSSQDEFIIAVTCHQLCHHHVLDTIVWFDQHVESCTLRCKDEDPYDASHSYVIDVSFKKIQHTASDGSIVEWRR